MTWRFSILDRNGVKTEIEEPVGWDQNTCEIKRDPDWHGIFFSNAGDSFEYYCDTRKMLKDEYEEYGVEGDMTLLIEQQCNPPQTDIITEDGIDIASEAGEVLITEDSPEITEDGYTEFWRGKFVFSKFEEYCDGCYVKVPVEAQGEIMDLRNRLDQKVNLDSLKAFDEVTDLVAYDRLPFITTLPSKGIVLHDNAINENENSTPVFGQNPGAVLDGDEWSQGGSGMIVPGFTKNVAGEIGSFYTETQPLFYDTDQVDENYFPAPGIVHAALVMIYPPYLSSIINCGEGTPNYDLLPLPVHLSFRFSGQIQNLNCRAIGGVVFYLYKEDKAGNLTIVNQQTVYDISPVPADNDVPIDISFDDPAFVLEQGAQYYAFFSCEYLKYKNAIDNNLDAFRLIFDTNTFFSVEVTSYTPPSSARVYAINEVISRISESITNDKLRAYSEYFGRLDSKPYAMSEDGCGGLEVITNGLRIRGQENKVTGQTSVFAVSLKDTYANLNAIHNIGMGVEADDNREGYNRLRVEQWQYFYSDDLIMSCTGINNLTRKTNDKEIYSTFEFGYSKWEAEQYTGLDEILTKRTYRLTLSQINNALQQVCNWIAAGYTWEITRRIGHTGSTDWRYDNDIFILCTRRGGEADLPLIFQASHGITVAILTDDKRDLITKMFAIGAKLIITGTQYNNSTFTILAADTSNPSKIIVTVAENVVNEYFMTPLGALQYISGHVFSTSKVLMDVELGNVDNPENIIDPNTLYNYRISPVRNAMRWMNVILASYRKFTNDSKIIFTDGDGNYFAKGMMKSTVCRKENQPIEENQTLDRTLFEDQDEALPQLMPERIQFDYPLTPSEYKAIEANPRGKIYYESNCEEGEGWIDTITYHPAEGTATFILIPKYAI